MDYNTRVFANNPVWDKSTTSYVETVTSAGTPEKLVIPAGARYVILSPLNGSIVVAPTSANGDPGVVIGSGGSFEIGLGVGAAIYIDVAADGDKVNATFFY
tara:strand:- start:13 stop:315 length:303 start_codon:yes stop_codon:yes gene_type:complete